MKPFNKICHKCSNISRVSAYGDHYVYPWGYKYCKVCENKFTKQRSQNNIDTKVYKKSDQKTTLEPQYLSRLIKILSPPFISMKDGSYKYKTLFKFIDNKDNKYNMVNIINDYNTFLLRKLSYNKLYWIKNNILNKYYHCNIQTCKYISNIYRKRDKNHIKNKIYGKNNINNNIYKYKII